MKIMKVWQLPAMQSSWQNMCNKKKKFAKKIYFTQSIMAMTAPRNSCLKTSSLHGGIYTAVSVPTSQVSKVKWLAKIGFLTTQYRSVHVNLYNSFQEVTHLSQVLFYVQLPQCGGTMYSAHEWKCNIRTFSITMRMRNLTAPYSYKSSR